MNTDYSGMKYERLIVLGETDRVNGRRRVLCKCECGSVISVDPRQLVAGKTRSCGCLQREWARGIKDRQRKHGASRTTEYESWLKMKARCLNPNDKKFPIYGGRGISITSKWIDSFECFISDVGKKPQANYTIDRIDVNGDYTPENVRWASPKQQARNKRSTIMACHDGENIPLADACEISGINYRTAMYRIRRGKKWNET